jgi:hypothetical protein
VANPLNSNNLVVLSVVDATISEELATDQCEQAASHLEPRGGLFDHLDANI